MRRRPRPLPATARTAGPAGVGSSGDRAALVVRSLHECVSASAGPADDTTAVTYLPYGAALDHIQRARTAGVRLGGVDRAAVGDDAGSYRRGQYSALQVGSF